MKLIDKQWIINNADDQKSRETLKTILEWREKVLKDNIFIDLEEEYTINFLGMKLLFKSSTSFSVIEVLYEIFKENSHLKPSGFFPEAPKVILDIGANQGFFCLKVKHLCPQCIIYAVEPNPYEFNVLKQNIINNNLKEINVDNTAMASHTGSLNMEIIPQIGSIGGKQVKIKERPWVKDYFVQTIEVPSISLDDYFDKYSLKHVDIAKIDVEGFELDILENSLVLDKIDRMVIEYHNRDIKKKITSILISHGFNLIYEDSAPDAYYGDIYFVKNNLRLSN